MVGGCYNECLEPCVWDCDRYMMVPHVFVKIEKAIQSLCSLTPTFLSMLVTPYFLPGAFLQAIWFIHSTENHTCPSPASSFGAATFLSTLLLSHPAQSVFVSVFNEMFIEESILGSLLNFCNTI